MDSSTTMNLNEPMNRTKTAKSFLSSSVKYLLVDLREECITSACPDNAVTPQLTFNWEVITHLLEPVIADRELDQQGYVTVCRKLWPVFNNCGRKVQAAKNSPCQFWKWTQCQDDIEACFEQLQSPESTSSIRVTLHLSALFENAIGNVYQTKDASVPFLLRDLLSSDQLLNVFGNFPILVARMLIGTPLALNVRNVCWHGFASPEEIHLDVASALLVLISSFGEILQASYCYAVPCRPKVDENDWAPFLPHFQSLNLPSLPADDVLNFIEGCSSVPNIHKIYWTSSFNLLNTKCFSECLLLLLPALEHSLRCAFCLLNDCHDRICVAEQSTLYTTMDEILDQYFVTPIGIVRKNELPIFLGTALMEMLMDMFHSYEGPRIRDKVSHGECYLEQIPGSLANHVFWLALLVLVKLEAPSQNDLSAHLGCMESRYSAKFHSISKLRFEAKAVINKLEKLPLCIQSDSKQQNNISADILQLQSILLQYSYKFCKVQDDEYTLEEQIISFSEKPVSTLYRTRSDLTVIVSLRKIISAICKVCENCNLAVENRQNSLSQHVLRSRQRASFSRMLNFLPSLQAILKCITFLVVIQVLKLPDVIGKSPFMKKIQQYVENVSSLSSLDKNRWAEINVRSTDICDFMIRMLNFTSK